MKNKRKLVLSVAGMLLALIMMAVGVLAASNQLLLIRGKISTTVRNEDDVLITATVWYKIADEEYQKIGTKYAASDSGNFDSDIDMRTELSLTFKIDMVNYGKAVNLDITVSDEDDTQFSDNFDVIGSETEDFASPMDFYMMPKDDGLNGLREFVNSGTIFIDAGYEEETSSTFYLMFNLNNPKALDLSYSMLLFFGEAPEEGYNSITFDSNGGSSVQKIMAPPDTPVSAPQNPVREGYVFAGWYSNAALTAPYEFTVMPQTNLKLYAKWTPVVYTITYSNLQGGTNPNSGITQYTIESPTISFAPPAGRTDFVGSWDIPEIPTGSTGDKIITAIWVDSKTALFDFDETTGTITGLSEQARNAREIVIPQHINGVDVVVISDFLFRNCTNLTSVTIPLGVEIIGNSAFYNCPALTSLNLPNSVISIGSSAFRGCTGIKRLILPDSVIEIGNSAFRECVNITFISLSYNLKTIGGYAFMGCSGFSSIIIPNSVTFIGSFAFQDCANLRYIYVNRLSTQEITELGNNMVFNGTHASRLIYMLDSASRNAYRTAANWSAYASVINDCAAAGNFTFSAGSITATALTSGEVIIPPEINGIKVTQLNTAFYSKADITSVVIPPSVTLIDYRTFRGCTGLKTVYMPVGVTTIGNEAFYGCSNDLFTTISLPEGVTSIGISAFQSCTKLTSITLPSSLTSIGISAFSSCTALTSIALPAGLTSIGSSAFSSCTSLGSIIIPAGVPAIGDSAFSGCTSLTTVKILAGVVTIGNSSFQGCSALTSVALPEGLASIGNNAFQNCTAITLIILPDGLVSIGNSTFQGCNKLTSITLPSSLTSLGASAFQNCTELTTANMAASAVTALNDNTFYGCAKLNSVTLPANLSSIGGSAFYGCSVLSSVTLPSSLSTIGNTAFQNCAALTTITIPAGVISIGNSAFNGCTMLAVVNIGRTYSMGLTTLGTSAFAGCSASLIIYVPDSASVTQYKLATNWSSYATSITLKE